jgi:hypothetical protein
MKSTVASGLQWMTSSTITRDTGAPRGSIPFFAKNRSSWFQLSRLHAKPVPLSNECMAMSLS